MILQASTSRGLAALNFAHVRRASAPASLGLAALNFAHVRRPAGALGLRGFRGLGDGCQDYYSWTAMLGVEDCGIYCNSSGCDQATATACNARNNARMVAAGEIQQQYGACVPIGATISVNPATGAWSTSAPVPGCPANDPNCRSPQQIAPPSGGTVVGAPGGAPVLVAPPPPAVPPATPPPAAPPAQSNAPGSTTVGAGVSQSNAPGSGGAGSSLVLPSLPAVLTGSSLISGFPNWAVGVGALVLLFTLVRR